ncbi:MAG: SoxR reducing system RseC family protein [Clostridia bacterium]|nr:SoxR reducing system RseC family protein [Clostridia bacterium]
MKAVGIVTKTENNSAIVVSERSSACSSCHNCEAKGACHAEIVFGEQTQSVEVSVKNTVGAKCGDKVELESSTLGTLAAAFSVFVVPVVLTLMSYFLLKDSLEQSNLLPIVLIAVFCIGFFVLGKIINQVIKKKHTIYIVGILEESKENLEAE